MATVIVLYKTPKNPATFASEYNTVHIPLARKLPGLRKYEISQGAVATPSGPSAYRLIATLTFDNLSAIQAAFASPEGQAAAAHAATLADLEILIFENQTV
ncbi:MAG: EthD family reductase [Acidobacteriaceae bacterium]